MEKIPNVLIRFSRIPFSRTLLSGSTFVLLYHEVSDNPSRFHAGCDLTVTVERFEEQIAFFSKNFHAITPLDLLKGNYPRPAFLVTFDDGAAGYFENALPVLAKYSCPSIIFLNMAVIKGEIFRSGLVTYLCEYVDSFKDFIADKKYPSPAFLYISDNDIEGFLKTADRKRVFAEAKDYYGPFAAETTLEKHQNNRLVYFANHLYNHHNAAMLAKDELIESFQSNQTSLAKFSNSIPFFSYPFGQKGTCYNSETNRILINEGAQVIFYANPPAIGGKNRLFNRLPMTMEFTDNNLSAYLIGKRIQGMLRE